MGGNNTNDYNIYGINGSGNYGTVRGDNNVVDMTELRAAWSGYSKPNNDANSSEAEIETKVVVVVANC